MSVPRRLLQLVDGRLERPEHAALIETRDPSDESILATAPEATAETVAMAVAAARRAYDVDGWPRRPVRERAALLLHVADLLEDRLEAFAMAESADTGMCLRMTLQGHLPRAVAHLRHFAEEAVRYGGDYIPMDDAYAHLVERGPLGVVAMLTPWNAPLAVATINLAPALATGNTVVLKSSERAPLTLSMLAELFAAADFPPGVVNILHGRAYPTGEALTAAPGIDGLCFVGGTATAKAIAAKAPFRRRHLFELGGKSPTLIFADAPLEEAVDGALLSVFSSNGEVCTAGSRILVHERVLERFTADFVTRARAIQVGDPRNPDTELGPLIDAEHLRAVLAAVETGIAEGATLLCGGERPPHLPKGHYMTPAVFGGVRPWMRIAREEIFGPVAAILSFADDDEALALANDTDYGLSASVWCGDSARGLSVARQLHCGVVGVNAPVIRDIRAPFGGCRDSGIGRVGGRWSLEQYTEVKTMSLRLRGLPLPRLGAKGMA
jgi:acyl-CoA reductase-like NAD-dependent aldehyde dehydrogenase